MAHLDRGEIPNLDMNSPQNQIDSAFFYPTYYYVYDAKFFTMQLFAIGFLMIIAFTVYIFAYQSGIVDPIESVKSTYINVYMISLLIIGGASFISVLFSKSKEKLATRLVVVLAISFIALSVFAIFRINLDGTYNNEWFENTYENTANRTKEFQDKLFSYDNLKLDIKEPKQYYVDECAKLYWIFKVKSSGLFVINFMLSGILAFLIVHTVKHNEEQKKVDRDDLILFDEEQNMRQ